MSEIITTVGKDRDKVTTKSIHTIDTGNIKEAAVTGTVYAVTAGDIALPADVETTIQECSIVSTGMPIFLFFSCSVYAEGFPYPTNYTYTIYRDATQIYMGTFSNDVYDKIIFGNWVNVPAAGSYTYYFKVTAADNNGFAILRALMMIEIKR